MPVIFENLDLPSGAAPNATVDITLVGPGRRPIAGLHAPTNKLIVGTTHLRVGDGIDQDGLWTLSLPSNEEIIPANTAWLIERDLGCNSYDSFVGMPVTGGPFAASIIEVDALNEITPTALALHAADQDLHGGGQTLFFTEITANFGPITGTGFVDVPGLVGTLTIPDRPFVIEAVLATAVETSGQFAEARIVFGSGPTQLTINKFRAGEANDSGKLYLQARIPTGTLHAPAPGSVVTYKIQFRTSLGTSDATIFVNFGAQIDIAQFWAETA